MMRKIFFILPIILVSCVEPPSDKPAGSEDPSEEYEVGDVVSFKAFKSKCNCVVERYNADYNYVDIYCEDSLGSISAFPGVNTKLIEECEDQEK